VRDDMPQRPQGARPDDDDRPDAFVERVAATLGALPPVNPAATARILAAVEARRRERDAAGAVAVPAAAVPATADRNAADRNAAGRDVVDLDAARRRRFGMHRFTVRALAGVGLAAAVGGFMVRGLVSPAGLRVADGPAESTRTEAVASGPADARSMAAESVAPAAQGLVPVADDAYSRRAREEAAAYVVPFLLAAPDARRVSVVGDFNGWDAEASPLVRDRSGVWTTLVPMRAGRHSYAFLVDGTVWTLDPRAPRMTDPDLGTQHSVLLVGTP
jgi:hypothetical protein